MKSILYTLVVCIASLFSCNIKTKNKDANSVQKTSVSKSTHIDSNSVILENIDTIILQNRHLQIERLKLDTDEITIINKFEGDKLNDTLSYINYKGLQVIFRGDTINKFVKQIENVCDDNVYTFIPVFEGDSLMNSEGFQYKKVYTVKNEYRILIGWFYNCNCNGNAYMSKVFFILKSYLSKNVSEAFLVGVNSDLIDLEKTQFFANGDSLIIKAKLNQKDKIITLSLFNNKIVLAQAEDSSLCKQAFFCIK